MNQAVAHHRLSTTSPLWYCFPRFYFGSRRAAAPESAGLVYQPHGDAIVPRNGSRWDNLPRYCLPNPF